MRPILVIEQEELLRGAGLLAERLETLGAPTRYVRTWEEDLSGLRARDFGGLVPLGGKMHAWEDEEHRFLGEELRLLDEALAAEIPVLGICLGAQLLARTLGAHVGQGESPEIGWLEVRPTEAAANDPLLGHLRGSATVYQWHLAGFELPAGATHLASSEAFPCQAFRHGNAWGVQFHPEVDRETFELWLGNHPGAASSYGLDEDELRESVTSGLEDERSLAFRVGLFDAFARYATLVAGGEPP